MLRSSHLAFLSLLLVVASSTPVVPQDELLAEEYTEEAAEGFQAPAAAPRQVYTGHHDPVNEQAVATDAATVGDVLMVDEQDSPAVFNARQELIPTAAPSPLLPFPLSLPLPLSLSSPSSSVIYCPLPPQTITLTVLTTATMLINAATLWPRPLPKVANAERGVDIANDAGPIPTADLLQARDMQSEENNEEEEQEEETQDMPARVDAVQEADEEADQVLPYNPGGPMAVPTPPFPAILTTATTGANATLTTSSGCTTTMLGRLSNPCRVRGPLTEYTSTTTLYTSVDCNGCVSVHVVQPIWGCPIMSVETTLTAATPSTWTSTVCADPTALSNLTVAGVTGASTTSESTTLSSLTVTGVDVSSSETSATTSSASSTA
ncbi:hypothetical protein VP1G_01932 [Cytospora mali]|uniref:Uncharacterized protein n=1 Tax=Cytospora mali TaxID=578113 RepID=A0A194USH6_CYTMA|nr:hypothetical protein VP1G_01932 [Valsa mali var. pyri (nom. inval.)]